MLARIFAGEQLKHIANDSGVAPSTVSGRYARALGRLELTPGAVPVAFILAALASLSFAEVPRARNAFLQIRDQACNVISVPRPDLTHMVNLTAGERAVASAIIEGSSRLDIARSRKTSVHTVARQFQAIFKQEQVSGRFALIRRAVELGCFRRPPGAAPG